VFGGRAPEGDVRNEVPLKLKHFCFSDAHFYSCTIQFLEIHNFI